MGASNKALANALKGLNTESKVAIVSQYGLTKAQKLGILASSGLTAEELKNVASTNAMATSQTVATGTTTGLTTAIKGLGTSLLNLAKAHPYLLAIAGTIAAIKLAKWGMDNIQNWADGTTAVNKYNKSIEKSEQTISDNESSISDYNSQLDENKQKLAELQELQTNGTITDAQKTEIENLKYENALLDDKIKKLQEANEEEKKSQANDSKKSFNKQFGDGYDVGSNANDVIKAVSKNYNGDGTANGVSWNLATSGNENDTTVAQLAKIKLATDAYNQAVSDFNNGLNNVTQDDVDNYATVLDLLTKDFEKNKETLYNQLKSDMEKMKAVEGTDDYDATAYANMQSWLEIFQQYIPEYKKAMEKVQEEADKNPIEQGIEVKPFDDPTSLLTESDDKGTSTATLADLQSEADLLSTIQKELSDNGKIGVSSMQSIIKQYPEAKSALSDYMQGMISEEELFAELENIYNDDKNQYIQSVVDKSQADEEFFNAVMTNYPELFNELHNLYGDSVEDWHSMAQAKLEIDNNLVSELAGLWTDYFKAVKGDDGMYSVQTTGWFDAGMYSADQDEVDAMDAAYENARNKYQSVVDRANDAISALNNFSYRQIDSSINLDWKGMSGYDSSSSSGSSDSSSDPTPEKLNWIERLINKISTAYSRLKNIVSDTTSTWLNRNNALSDSMNTLSDEINAQKQAYEYYMNAFNSYGLDDYWKDQIANGSISIDVIYDDDLKDAISDCQDFYDKAQDAKTAVQELGIELNGLAKTRFDNVASQYQAALNKMKAYSDQLGKEQDIIQEKGWFDSIYINSSLIEQEQRNLEKLEAERNALTNALNSAVSSGKIAPESEDWYSMQASIDDVSSSILDAKKALIEYDNAIRQVKWDAFDRTRDDVSNLIDETQFLIDLFKDKGITDDEGNINDNGKAAQALIAQKYQLYLNQAQKYKDEILKINEEIANDPADKELLDRKQELIKAQQDAISASYDEKNALKDLVNDGLTAWSDKLSELIDKYKDLMSQQQDAYNYEKSIKEKTDALNKLEKQYSATKGDTSEEGKKNIQQLKDQINSAKEDLSDTQYEQLISDTEKLLDNLQDEVKTWIDERLDNIDQLMQDIIEQSNTNAGNIADTITTTANEYGYNLSQSMSDIWNTSSSNIINGVGSVLGEYGTKMSDGLSNINTVVNGISSAVQEMLRLSNEEAQRVADEIKRQQEAQNADTNTGGYSDSGSSSDNSDNWTDNWDNDSGDDGGSSGSWGDWFYHLEDSYPKSELETETSIVDFTLI